MQALGGNIFENMSLHRAKRARRQEVQCRKGYHEKGMWNVNTVMMGGLGGGLGSSSSEEGTVHMHSTVIGT